VCHTCRNFVKAEVKSFPSSVESCCMIMRRLLKLIKSINTLHANQFSSLHTKCRLLVWRNREGKTVYLLCFFFARLIQQNKSDLASRKRETEAARSLQANFDWCV
jgi:hypothetical protein